MAYQTLKNKTTGNKAYRYRLEKISVTWFFIARPLKMALAVATSLCQLPADNFFRSEKKGSCRTIGGAPPIEVGGTNAPVSAKPAEAHPPALIMLAINAAIRRITNTASEDTLFAFIRQLELAAFCEGG